MKKSPAAQLGHLKASLKIAAINTKAHLMVRVAKDCEPNNYAKWVAELNPVLEALGISTIKEA